MEVNQENFRIFFVWSEFVYVIFNGRLEKKINQLDSYILLIDFFHDRCPRSIDDWFRSVLFYLLVKQ